MNLEALNKMIEDRRINISAIAETMGISRQTLYHKLAGTRDFTTSEVNKLSDYLRLTNEEKLNIFFAN